MPTGDGGGGATTLVAIATGLPVFTGELVAGTELVAGAGAEVVAGAGAGATGTGAI